MNTLNTPCPNCINKSAAIDALDTAEEDKCSVCNDTAVIPSDVAQFINNNFHTDGNYLRYYKNASPNRSLRIEYDISLVPSTWQIAVLEYSDNSLEKKNIHTTVEIVRYVMKQ